MPPASPGGSKIRGWQIALIAGVLVVVVAVVAAMAVVGARHGSVPLARSAATGTSVPMAGFVDPAPVPTTPASTLLSSSITTEVVNELWPSLVRAAAENSPTELSRVASPDVVALIQSLTYCGCGFWPTAYRSLKVSAPAEPTYPLSFLAEIDQPDDPRQPEVQLLVIGKVAPSGPWLIEHLSGYGGTTTELVSPDAFNAQPTASSPGTMAFDDLAAELTSLRTTGTSPAGNLWNDTAAPGASNDQQPTEDEHGVELQLQNDRESRYLATGAFVVADLTPPFWTGTDDIQCAAIIGQIRVSPDAGVKLSQPTSRDAFGPTVAPGTYASVTQKYIFEVCIDRPTTELFDVAGMVGGTLTQSGQH